MADSNSRWRWRRSRLLWFVLTVGRGERHLAGGAVRGKRKMADHAGTERSRRAKASGRKRAAEGPILYIARNELTSRRRRHVSLPLVSCKQPGTLALDNAKIFEVIPFP